MSAPQWKPGDVAVIPFGAGPATAVWVSGKGWLFPDGSHPSCGSYAGARPLVVVDPDSAEQMEALARAWVAADADLDNAEAMTMPALRMRVALRSLVTDPKPDEPQGLGAVVEDAEGFAWVRVTTDGGVAWKRQDKYGDANRKDYESVAAVRVLSEGVTA